jgi:glycerophosphoryl diester phosphodiesterase
MRDHPVAFAHRGARAHAPENTLQAFALALRLGANGLETDVWLTRDGTVVLDHDGVVRKGLRRVPISGCDRRDLPGHIPSLEEFFDHVGVDFDLSVDVKDLSAFDPLVAGALAAGLHPERLWICHPSDTELAARTAAARGTRLVCSTRMKDLGRAVEGRVAAMAAAGLHAVNMHHSEWTGGMCTLVHRFGLNCLAWDIQHDDRIRTVLRMGIDGIFSDHVDRMVDAYDAEIGRPPVRPSAT